MSYIYKSMIREYAVIISKWKYEVPYSIYSMDGSDDCISDLLNGDYVCVLTKSNEIVGFFCTGDSARVPGGYMAGIYKDSHFIDFGLGLKPELTGLGLGKTFVSEGVKLFTEHHKNKNFRLVVAAFNYRAIRVYESIGFIKNKPFLTKIGDQDIEFISMTLKED